jgi:hypothetical protein
MGLCMDMFLDQNVKEKALGKMTPAEKTEKRRLTGQIKNDQGARLSACLMAITDGYAIGPQRLAWDRMTRDAIGKGKERKVKTKSR